MTERRKLCHISTREERVAYIQRLILEGRWVARHDLTLAKAWGLEPNSRLGCQALVGATPLTVEIPKYSINMAKEGHRK